MNCRGSGTYAALGNTPSLPRALERHAMPERLMMEDAALAEDARNGSAAAFVKLAKRWWTPLYRVSWNISGSASCAAQITERTLLAAIHSAEPPTLREFRSKYSSIELPPLSKCSSPQRRE